MIISSDLLIFTARRYASAVYDMVLCPTVCLSRSVRHMVDDMFKFSDMR